MAEPSLFDHANPAKYSPGSPLTTFIVQWVVIIGFSRVIALLLEKLRQPKVVAEVLAGIVVGPTALGRIPAFTNSIFPADSIPNLKLVANIGLVLFLFLVGLEVDFHVFKKNALKSLTIGAFSVVFPFGIGAAVSVGIYNRFVDPDRSFGIFVLFIGTAMAITALPVLARILSELGLLSGQFGVVVLGAGVVNDVIGWVLLALAIALVNASSGIVILWVVLCMVGIVLFLFFAVKPVLDHALVYFGFLNKQRTHQLREPSQTVVAFILFLVFASAWFTDKIGVHAIFGGFLMGLIVPSPLRPHIVEKIEDLISVLCLPLYFALSGLNTDMTLLNTGVIWGWTIGITLIAVFAKFIPSVFASKVFCRVDWRESCAIGSLMACKGLVELIVLNVGLNAHILNNRIFAMFVFMTLITTFLTTPLMLLFYPHRVRGQKALAPAHRENADNSDTSFSSESKVHVPQLKLGIVIEHFSDLSASLVASLIYLGNRESALVHSLRVFHLSERLSMVLQASSAHELQSTIVSTDPLCVAFRSCIRVHGVQCMQSLAFSTAENLTADISSAFDPGSTVLLPWVWSAHHRLTFAEPFFNSRPSGQDRVLFLTADSQEPRSFPSFFSHIVAFHVGGPDDDAVLRTLAHVLANDPSTKATVITIPSGSGSSSTIAALAAQPNVTVEPLVPTGDPVRDVLRLMSFTRLANPMIIVGRNYLAETPWIASLRMVLIPMRDAQLAATLKDAAFPVPEQAVRYVDLAASAGHLAAFLLYSTFNGALAVIAGDGI